MKFKGKCVVVTGGSRGIGAAVAKAFAAEGADLALIYAGNTDKAEELASALSSGYGVTARTYKCDVSDYEQAKSTVNQIKTDFGTFQVLVNNAGITRDGLVAMMKESEWDDVIDVNLKGAFNMIRHSCGVFIRNKGGSIINMSSVCGLMGNPGQANYSASKAGLIGLTKAVAKEFAPRGITCNAVAPGFIRTDMTRELDEDNELSKAIPLKRAGEAEEVADAVLFLASSTYITGEVIRVDGGLAI